MTTGRRNGIIIMVAGLVVAVLAAVLVFMVAQRSRVPASAVQTVPQVFVVMAVQDIEPGRPIPADAVAVKPFPKAFAPQGALATLEELNGKYATARLTRDQIVLESQVSATRPSTSLTDSIPVGKVALWMPLPSLLAQADMLRAGDKVDILLSLSVEPPASSGGASEARASGGLTTQTTLQNVELLFVGTPPSSTEAKAASAPAGSTTATSAAAQAEAAPSGAGATMVLFVVDPQDAVVAKFVKDSGGMIDFVMRSREPQNLPRTVAVNATTLDDRFTFSPR